MKILQLIGGTLVSVSLLVGCAEHNCEFENEDHGKSFSEIAGMTKGANGCSSRNATAGILGEAYVELSATHYDATVDAVADKYEAYLTKKGWDVEVKPYEGKRANGKPLSGKMVLARKDGRQLGTTIYALTDGIINTATMDVPDKKEP